MAEQVKEADEQISSADRLKRSKRYVEEARRALARLAVIGGIDVENFSNK